VKKLSDNYPGTTFSGGQLYGLTPFLLLCLLWSIALPVVAADYTGKRIMYVDSYHQEYPWSIGVNEGIASVLKDSGVTLKIHRMDTKRNRSPEFIRQAAERAHQAIEEFKPDLIIVSDDNAFKHVAQAFYKDADLPVVFCGLNGDAASYGLPYSNTTGMFEIGLIESLMKQLRPYARGDRIGFLALDSISSMKIEEEFSKNGSINLEKTYLIENFEDWKAKFLALQKEVDVIVFAQKNGIEGWNNREARKFVLEHSQLPSGALDPDIMDIAVLGFLRSSPEQGRWAASAALKILDGAAPSSLPSVRNQQARVVINHALSEKLGIVFPAALFKRAEIVWPYSGRKILSISSYHYDVAWAKEIQQTIQEKLAGSGVELRTFIMGAKRDGSELNLRNKALQVKQLIEDFQPDVVITVDDAAAKYVISEHYRESKLPFVFSGVNWDASAYGLPTDNVTGMIEVESVVALYKQLKRYARGSKIGMLSENSFTQQKNIDFHGRLFGIKYDRVELVENFDDWKKAFLALQNDVDMLVIGSPHAISGWNLDEAIRFVHEHTKIPTGSLTYHTVNLTVIGYVRLPEEQGEWVSQSALKILDGVSPGDIPLAQNQKARLVLNRRLLEKLGIVVDRSLYRMADIIE